MEYVLNQNFLPERFFEEICRIPHGSGNEKALSDYLVRFAKDHGLSVCQYPNWNVIVRKEASPGYEKHEPVMLQAHMDMVCEKELGSSHDFSRDPLSLFTADGWLKARGTTLGADDGVGVAYMLAILSDETAVHPPLECVFTVEEEVGLNGSRDLSFKDLHSKRMIGLDDMGGGTCYLSACGSQYFRAGREFAFAEGDVPGIRMKIIGLSGGHSGVSINKEKGNAIKLGARVLLVLSRRFPLRLSTLSGGGADNAIPTEFCVSFSWDGADPTSFGEVQAEISRMESVFREELADSDPGIVISTSSAVCQRLMSGEDTKDLIHYLFLLPHGLRHKSMKIEGLTTVSENLASIRTEEDQITIRYLARSDYSSYLDEIMEELIILSETFGFAPEPLGRAPGWKYRENSPLRDSLFAAFREVTGREMKPISEHGGLEAGYISEGIPGIDIVTLGPLVLDYHTPKERLNLASFREIYEVLKETLKKL